jgi:hypothetical protein
VYFHSANVPSFGAVFAVACIFHVAIPAATGFLAAASFRIFAGIPAITGVRAAAGVPAIASAHALLAVMCIASSAFGIP